jgi:predicted DNA-binding protein
MKRTNFFMPHEMHRGLKDLAHRSEVSEAELVRRAVRAYLKRYGIDVPE